jgi:cell migration-inducing and hyaluronan-binding protein
MHLHLMPASLAPAPGRSATAALMVMTGGARLGSWTVDVSFDADALRLTGCDATVSGATALCNAAGRGVARVSGSSATGVSGDIVLATLTFESAGGKLPGASPLTITAASLLSPGVSPSPSATPAPSASPSPTASPTPSPTPSPSGKPSPTLAPTPSPSPTASPSPSPGGQQRWSDPATWGGSVPAAGAQVTIPAGKSVLLDISPPALKSLTVDGTLVFADQDLNLSADWIMVHGTFQIGTEARPYTNRATMTLTGSNAGESIDGMGTKVLGVMGGTLELHGEARTSWTRLAQSATAGARTLTLEQPVNWRAGDHIVVASTDYNPAQAEELVIGSISGTTVQLQTPLRYGHWGQTETIAGQTISERAEVGLLTRNILIQGDAGSETAGFGGHVMVHTTGVTHIEGVELYRMGQRRALGRYPFHWHLVADATGSYFNNSAVHHSFNRCVTIHGSNRALVRGNVAYDAVGHCYFFEDGAETKNTMEGNLGLYTRRPAAGQELLPSDINPATFWVTNPDNIVRNNVAAGSQSFGFWYALPEHPTGVSHTAANDANVWPRRTPLGEFSGNVAHSNDHTGLFVDNGPRLDGTVESTYYHAHQNPIPTSPDSPDVQNHFRTLTAWRNRGRGAWLRGAANVLEGALMADNAIGATFASSETFLQDSLVIGETSNKGNPGTNETKGVDGRTLPAPWEPSFPIRGFEFYDGRVGAQRVTFANFQSNAQRKASGLSYLRDNAFAIDPRNFAESITFLNANPVYEDDPHSSRDGDHAAVFLDSTGSVTGTAGKQVVVNFPFLLTPGCLFQSAWNAYVCQNQYGRLHIQNRDATPAAMAPLSLTRDDDGSSVTLYGTATAPAVDPVLLTSVLTGRAYRTQLGGSTPGRLRLQLFYRQPGDWIRLAIPYNAATAYVYRDYYIAAGSRLNAASSLAALDAGSGDLYFLDGAGGLLYVKMQVRADRDYAEIDVCQASLCQ